MSQDDEITTVKREKVQEMYEAFLKHPTRWVFIISGIEGSGKKTTLDHLESSSIEAVVRLDITDMSLNIPFIYLYSIANALQKMCGVDEYKNFITVFWKVWNEYNQFLSERVKIDAETLSIRTVYYKLMIEDALLTLIATFPKDHLIFMFDRGELCTEQNNQKAGCFVSETLKRVHERMLTLKKKFQVVFTSSVYTEHPSFSFMSAIDRDRAFIKYFNIEKFDQDEMEKCLKENGLVVSDVAIYDYLYEITYGHAACIGKLCAFWKELPEEERIWPDPTNYCERSTFQKKFYEYICNNNLMRVTITSDDLFCGGIMLREFCLNILSDILYDAQAEDEEIYQRFLSNLYIYNLNGSELFTIKPVIRAVYAMYARNHVRQFIRDWEKYHQTMKNYYQMMKIKHNVGYSEYFYHCIAEKLTLSERTSQDDWERFLRLLLYQNDLKKKIIMLLNKNARLADASEKAVSASALEKAANDEVFRFTPIEPATRKILRELNLRQLN